jgi:5-formyltetrahydrofolate cyclo-ligase
VGRCSLNPVSKSEWRAWANTTRAALPNASGRIGVEVGAFLKAYGAGVVLSYRAFGNEVDLEGLFTVHPEMTWLTTRTNSGKRLTLHAFSSATVKSRFGILEPSSDAPEVDPRLVDAVLVPGLAFDVTGVRLGYGAGYYDRLLPRFRPGIPIIGVTRDALVVSKLPFEDHDVPVTHLATESGVRTLEGPKVKAKR